MTPTAPGPARIADAICTSVGNRRRTIVTLFRGARRRIDLSLFRCDDPHVFEEIRHATARGVKVNVLVTARAHGGRRKLTAMRDALLAAGAAVRVHADPVVKYHAKYMVVDDGPAMVASFNFTRKCFARTNDACVITFDPEVVAGLRALIAADSIGDCLPDGLTPRLIVGPERSREPLSALIGGARSSIRLIDPKLSDPRMQRLLEERRADGLIVDLFDGRRLGALKSHGRILLIDDRIAVVGSVALAPISLDFRREVALVVDHPDAIATVVRLFRSITDAPRRYGYLPERVSPNRRNAAKEAQC